MVSSSGQIPSHHAQQLPRSMALESTRVGVDEAIAVHLVSRIDEQQINPALVCLGGEMGVEGSEVAEVGCVEVLLEVATDPAMGVSDGEDVEVSPWEGDGG